MNVKLLTKDFFKKRGGEQLDDLDDKTKIVSFIKLPKSVNDYMGDKGQTKNFKFSSVDTDIFDDKSGSSGHFAFNFNQPKGFKALDEFYDEMLPPIDYSGELPEYYEYKLNKGKTTNDRIVDKLRENALDEDATRLPEAQELYPQFKTKKGKHLIDLNLNLKNIIQKRFQLYQKTKEEEKDRLQKLKLNQLKNIVSQVLKKDKKY